MTGGVRGKSVEGLSPAATLGTILLAAVLVGGFLFVLTSWHEIYTISGPVCQDRTLEAPGFDPWTGMPHGVIVTCPQFGGQPTEATLPPDLLGRQAIPVPVGAALGAGLAAVVLVVAHRRRRDTSGT